MKKKIVESIGIIIAIVIALIGIVIGYLVGDWIIESSNMVRSIDIIKCYVIAPIVGLVIMGYVGSFVGQAFIDKFS